MTPELQAHIIQRQAGQIGDLHFQNTVLAAQLALCQQELENFRDESGAKDDSKAKEGSADA